MLWLSSAWLVLLIDVSVKSLLLAALAGAVLAVLRVRDTNVQHRVWTGVLAGMLVLPLLVPVTPRLPLPAWLLPAFAANEFGEAPATSSADSPSASSEIDTRGEAAREATRVPPPVLVEKSPVVRGLPYGAGSGTLAEHASTQPAPGHDVEPDAREALPHRGAVAGLRPGPEPARRVWLPVIFAVYASVLVLSVFRLLVGILAAARLAGKAQPIPLKCHDVCADETGSLARVAILESPAIRLPLTAGYLRPKILLPPEWRQWSKTKRAAVLAHELAHIERGDYLVTLLAEWNRCLYWFHPLAWHLRGRLSRLAEQSCDDAVIVSTGNRTQYARYLLELAGELTGRRGRILKTAGIPMARHANVERRIAAILDPKRPPARRIGRLASALLIAVVAPAVVLAAALHPASEHASSAAGETARAGAEPEVVGEASPPSATREDAPGGEESEFHGRVLDSEGNPLAKARLDLPRVKSRERGTVEIEQLAVTGPDGTFGVPSAGSAQPGAEPDLTRLIEELKDEDPWVRLRAVEAIRKRDPTDVEPVPALIEAMSDESGRVRSAAAQALLRVGPVNKQVVLAFIRASRDNWKGVIYAADDFFHLVGPEYDDLVPELTEMLKDPTPRVRRCAVTALYNMGPKAESAAAALVGAMRDDETLCLAVGALKNLGPGAKAVVPELIEVLGGADLGASQEAARVLAAIGPDAREAVPVLTDSLKRGHDPWGQLGLCNSLATLHPGSSEAIDALKKLTSDKYRPIQPAAHYHLLKMGESRATHFQAMVAALEDSSQQVRLTATTYLGTLGEEASQATPPLLAALNDVDPEIRVEAARSILLVCPKGAARKRAADVLLKATEDDVFMARLRAFSALEAFGPEESWSAPALTTLATNTSIPQARFRLNAINALGNIGSAATEAIPSLRPLLKDHHWQIRQNAREVINKIERRPERNTRSEG